MDGVIAIYPSRAHFSLKVYTWMITLRQLLVLDHQFIYIFDYSFNCAKMAFGIYVETFVLLSHLKTFASSYYLNDDHLW